MMFRSRSMESDPEDSKEIATNCPSARGRSLTRRELLQHIAGVGTALVLGAQAPLSAIAAVHAPPGTSRAVTAWVRIRSDNTVTLLASQSEMGQGATTTLAAALADELYLPFA